MKDIILTILLLLSISTFGQSIKQEKTLNDLIEKRNYWYEVLTKEYEEKYSDSLNKYNAEFEKYLLKSTNTIPETLKWEFNILKKNSINILTSKDGNFRIYTWNTLSGGTMQFYRNIFQYKVNGKVYSKINNTELEDNGCSFYEVNEIVSKNKIFYITSSINVGSSAVYYYEAKIFSIENDKLNEDAKLIKTKTGINNALGYEIDLSMTVNRNINNVRKFVKLEYDKKNKVIIIPLITNKGKITEKKIRYKFRGEYFEKL